ncbi:MAG: hypothetical protein FWG92_02590 [Leptospirales bacterium]|nr:hypothetical protein [Leptospirales bacterium]
MNSKRIKRSTPYTLTLLVILLAGIITGCAPPPDSGNDNAKYYFVAISRSTGNGTKGAYSEDGKEWVSIESPTLESQGTAWYGICYGKDKFVIVGVNTGVYSHDGLDWHKIETLKVEEAPYTVYNSVCYGDGMFVAVSSTNRIAYSEDGIEWQQKTLDGGLDDYVWQSVCYGKDKSSRGMFVAVGNAGSDTGTRVAYSYDGIGWNVKDGLLSPFSWVSVCNGEGKFAALATKSSSPDTDVIAFSDDGLEWEEINTGFGSYWKAICYGGGKFVAVNNQQALEYSEDGGDNWERKEFLLDRHFSDICYGKDKFVTVSTRNANPIVYSENGKDWIETTIPGNDSSNDDWYLVGYGRVDSELLRQRLYASSQTKQNSLLASIVGWVNDKTTSIRKIL